MILSMSHVEWANHGCWRKRDYRVQPYKSPRHFKCVNTDGHDLCYKLTSSE